MTGAIANISQAVLKKPLHTSIAVDMEEFDDIEVQDKLHIIVSVKDFRGILHHAQMTSGELSACYSNPGRPMKLSYGGDGVLCEFILMTVGEKDVAGQKGKKTRTNAAKSARPGLEAASNRASSVATETHHPQDTPRDPPRPAPSPPPQQKTPVRPRQSQFEIRPPPLPPPSTLRSDLLFVPQGDDDQQWEPVNPEDEEDQGEMARLEWDASGQQVWASNFWPVLLRTF
jgi:cell cycle checkpoint control protein RAD9A